MSNLTTLAAACLWLDVPQGSNDVVINRLITAISATMQAWLGYNVTQQTYTSSFNGRGGCRLFIPECGPAAPLTAVSSLTINGTAVPAGTMQAGGQTSGYFFDDKSIGVIGWEFCRGFQNISATYTTGNTIVPPGIEQACLDWIQLEYALTETETNLGISEIKAGDTEIKYAGRSAVTDPKKIPLPPSILTALSPFRRVIQI